MEQSITTQHISLTVSEQGTSKTMGVYLAKPTAKGQYPGILLFMEIFGINSHIKDVAERLARQGYVVLVPDVYHRTAPGIESSYDQAGMEKGMPLREKLRREEVMADTQAALTYLKSHSTGKIGVIGFCVGGHLAYFVATQFDVQAVASFYGGAIANTSIPLSQPQATVELTPQMAKHSVRIFCFFGGKDPMIPAEERLKIQQALQSAHINHEIIVYPDASHGFFCDQRGAFHQTSRDDAWQKVLTLFSQELSPHK